MGRAVAPDVPVAGVARDLENIRRAVDVDAALFALLGGRRNAPGWR